MRDRLILGLAQGFGSGRLRFGPGTCGSLVGLLWFALLLLLPNLWLFLAAALAAAGMSVWICGAAERLLKESDPPSVVLDEIVALPLCFLAALISHHLRTGQMGDVNAFFGSNTWIRTALVFGLFRLFDIVKPWPVRQSQKLPGGWGVTVDDLLAAVYVNLVQLPFFCACVPVLPQQ